MMIGAGTVAVFGTVRIDMTDGETGKPTAAVGFTTRMHDHSDVREMPEFMQIKLQKSLKERRRDVSKPATTTVKTADSETYARITLVVENDWGDGSGYQILLDADDSIYQDYVEGNPASDAGVYDECEYTVPANAVSYGNYLIAGERRSTDIPAGVYDFVVLNPAPSGLFMVKEGDNAGDNVTFEAGKEYVFTITNDGSSDKSTLSLGAPVDLSVTAITSPASGYLTDSETITATITNNGMQDATSFTATFQIDETEPVTETVNQTVAAGASISYSFATKGDFSEGKTYQLTVSVASDDDATPDNNQMTASVNHIHAVPAPYYCGFDEESDLGEWTIIDANDDWTTWYIDTSWGQAMIDYDYEDLDDYLVTTNPVSLPAGTCHVTVTYNGAGSGYYERFEILYGKTSEVEEMTVIQRVPDFEGADDNYVTAVDFNVPEAGDYFFAIHATSMADQYGIIIEDITIDAGSYRGEPDLEVARISLPLSSSSLGTDETVGVDVVNRGTAGATSFKMECYVDGTLSGTQSVSHAVAAGETITITLDEAIDLSQPGVHTVNVRITDVEADEDGYQESVTDNNSMEATVTHFMPAGLPFETDFTDPEQRADWDGCGSWSYTEGYRAMYCAGTGPLLSRGVKLETGKFYRIEYVYMAGMNSFFGLITENYSVACALDGRVAEDGWTVLDSYEDVYTNDAFVNGVILFQVEQDGLYQFGFLQENPQGTLSVCNFSVNEYFNPDVAVVGVSRLPSLLPLSLAGLYDFNVFVKNKGGRPVSGYISVNDDFEIKRFGGLEPSETGCYEMTVDLQDIVARQNSDIVTLSISVPYIEGNQDENMDDNTYTYELGISEDELAYDHTTDDKYDSRFAMGVGTGSATAAIPMHLTSTALLRGFSVGWGEATGQDITLAIYEWDPDKDEVGDKVYESVAQQGVEAGQIEYPVDGDVRLSSGDYMVGVTFSGYCMATDYALPGQLYMLVSDESGKIVALDQRSARLGTPAIRLVLDKDAAVESIGSDGVSVTLYPNPVCETLFVNSEGERMSEVEIYSAAGVTVYHATVDAEKFEYAVGGLVPGVYFARVTTESGTKTLKFAVEP